MEGGAWLQQPTQPPVPRPRTIFPGAAPRAAATAAIGSERTASETGQQQQQQRGRVAAAIAAANAAAAAAGQRPQHQGGRVAAAVAAANAAAAADVSTTAVVAATAKSAADSQGVLCRTASFHREAVVAAASAGLAALRLRCEKEAARSATITARHAIAAQWEERVRAAEVGAVSSGGGGGPFATVAEGRRSSAPSRPPLASVFNQFYRAEGDLRTELGVLAGDWEAASTRRAERMQDAARAEWALRTGGLEGGMQEISREVRLYVKRIKREEQQRARIREELIREEAARLREEERQEEEVRRREAEEEERRMRAASSSEEVGRLRENARRPSEEAAASEARRIAAEAAQDALDRKRRVPRGSWSSLAKREANRRLKRELQQEQLQQLQQEQPVAGVAPSSKKRWSRECGICFAASPAARAVYARCGHVTCWECASENERRNPGAPCPFCRASGPFVRLFEAAEEE